MKKIVLLFMFAGIFAFKTQATIHVIQVANFSFSPVNISNVIVGDTVRWVWVNGSHTTTDNPATNPDGANSLPAGAATWDASMNTGSRTFDYKVLVAGIYKYSCRPHQPDMAGSFTASASMPVILSEFKLSTANNKPGLTWKTVTEENTDYFSIRRSYDGATYTEIARIPAAGNSATEKVYSYNDINVSGKDKYAYYMIAIVDKDGTQQFTETRLFKNLQATVKLVTSISPNPISKSGHLMLQFNADKTGKMDVNILNMEGKAVLKTSMYAVPGVNNGHIHLGDLAPGTYNLIFSLDGTKETHRIIVK